jgi:hypothetical protein
VTVCGLEDKGSIPGRGGNISFCYEYNIPTVSGAHSVSSQMEIGVVTPRVKRPKDEAGIS